MSECRGKNEHSDFFDKFVLQKQSSAVTHFGVTCFQLMYYRTIARSENPGGHVVLGGDNVPPLVEIGLADLPKSVGGGTGPPGPPTCDGPAYLDFSNKLLTTNKRLETNFHNGRV